MKVNKGRGYSQIELMVAVLILAVGLLGVFAAFAFAHKSITYGGQVSQALNYAQTITELIRGRGMVDFALSNLGFAAENRSAINAAPFASDLPDDPTYKRKITLERVSSNPGMVEYNLARIKVQVFWEVPTKNGKVEKSVELISYYRQP